jgi:hypothetical protein
LNEKTRKIAIWLVASLLFQGTIYLYFDRLLFAPASTFQVTADSGISGKAYYSKDRRYMAVAKNDVVELHVASTKQPVRTIALGQQKVSYFKWLDDRALGLMATHSDYAADAARVVLTPVNPHDDSRQEVTATIDKLPKGSKITDVAFSTATNVIYMQVQVSVSPERYRVYRTDANHNLTRAFLTTTHIGRIATLFDLDYLIYDNLDEGTVIARHTDGSWEIISPTVGKYRLVGVDAANNIYIARMNNDGLATTVLRARIKEKFAEHKKLATPLDIRQVTSGETSK